MAALSSHSGNTVDLGGGKMAVATLAVGSDGTPASAGGGGGATAAGTATVTSVADSATSVTLKALNASRLGLSIVNDSSARLYIKCGTTATVTDYTVSLGQHESWECPFGFTGRVDGIWETDPGTGAARVTEYTA